MFGTSGVRGPVGETVTAELALAIGRAVASGGEGTVVIGRDARESGTMLADAASAGARECGADVIDLGTVATPTLARSIGWKGADAGIAITASHNPSEDNGLKLWATDESAFDGEMRAEIERRVRENDYDLGAWNDIGSLERWEGADETHVATLVERTTFTEPLRVVVDLGNGTGRVSADALYELGCAVETINAQPDGRFPGRPSEPTAENCETLRATVAATDADLGIAHDGDADRMRAVTADGEFVSGDALLALFASDVASDGDRIAAPINTSLAVDDALEALGATVERTPVGDVYVAECARAPDFPFGGEPSGAWIWPDETLCPDGPLAACKLVELVSRRGSLTEQLASIEEYPLRRESIRVEDKRKVMDRVSDTVATEYDRVETTDGVRVEVGEGWFLIRASGTEPLIRVTAEARDDDSADELCELARSIVESHV